MPPTVDPRWLLKAFGLIVLASLLCAYLTLCWLYYQGQWQLVLQPSAAVSSTPATSGLRFDNISFDDTEAGQPQLTGWWIPAASSTPPAGLTVLYFHDGRGNLSDALPDLRLLHGLGVDVFAIDYRGFGGSAAIHPSQQSMYADGDAAWTYLTATRKVAPGRIVLCGDRIGAAVAAEVALRHIDALSVMMISPYASLLPRALASPRSGLIPARLLFHNSFDLAAIVPRLRQPKLIASGASGNCSGDICPTPAEAEQLFKAAAFPKELFNGSGKSASPASEAEFISRFLDQYPPASAPAPH